MIAALRYQLYHRFQKEIFVTFFKEKDNIVTS